MDIRLMLGGTSVLSLAAGIGIGYKLTRKRLDTVYAEMIEQEIYEAKEHYETKMELEVKKVRAEYNEILKGTIHTTTSSSTITVKEKLVDPEELIPDELIKELRNYQGVKPSEAALEEVPDLKSTLVPTQPKVRIVPLISDVVGEAPRVFSKEATDMGEVGPPYLIKADEFMNTEVGYDQTTLTLFEGDGVVIDESDEILENAHTILGLSNLNDDKFVGTNTIYIRNEEEMRDFEVIRSDGFYQVEVLNEPAP